MGSILNDERGQFYFTIYKADFHAHLRSLDDILNLARRYGLSSYDASYLELALRENLPLATLDEDLIKSAEKAGIKIYY